MKKIIVTGGMGYIGSHTIIELLRYGGFEPISIDSCINSDESTIDAIHKITGVKIKNHKIDLCDRNEVFKTLEQYDNTVGVIHFAALKSVPESVENPSLYYINNINSLVNIMDWIKSKKVPNFIFSSSCAVYGNISNSPVDENTPILKAESPYAYTKQIGEQYLQDSLVGNHNLRCIALRYFNPAGADHSGLIGENPVHPPTALIPYITQFASGKKSKLIVFGDNYDTRDGSCIRDFIHVSDVAEAHIIALNYLINNLDAKAFDILNVGTGRGVTVLEAIDAFENATNLKLEYKVGERRAGDVEAIYSNGEKIKKLLQWEPKRSLHQMLDSAWRWQLFLNKNKL